MTFQTFIAFNEKVHYYIINFLKTFPTIWKSFNLDKIWFFKPYFEHLILLKKFNSTRGNSYGNSWLTPNASTLSWWVLHFPYVLEIGCCTYVVHYQAFNLALSQEHILLLLGGGCKRKLKVATLTSFSFFFKLLLSFY